MTAQSMQGGQTSGDDPLAVCPYLRLKHDHKTAATYVRRDHACGMLRNRLVAPDWQQQFCLTSSHTTCPHYVPDADPDREIGLRDRLTPYRREIVFLTVVFVLLIGAGAAVATRDSLPASGEPGETDSSGNGAAVSALPTETPIADPDPTRGPTAPVEEEPTATPTLAEPPESDVVDLANEFFEAVWRRVDLPVVDGVADRAWLWGPAPLSAGIAEPYIEAPGGERIVQYFEKSRMEINNPDSDPDGNWYVSSGLLVAEMVYGHHQVGDEEFQPVEPADVPILDTLEITYADIQLYGLDGFAPVPAETVINQTLVDGEVINTDDFTEYGVTSAILVDIDSIHHAIASVFWEFMNSQSTVWQENGYIEADLFVEPLYATGYPITEAYWATLDVDGESLDVLWQCFERRCLTFTPTNAPEWQVESNNAGAHYFEWRYGTRP